MLSTVLDRVPSRIGTSLLGTLFSVFLLSLRPGSRPGTLFENCPKSSSVRDWSSLSCMKAIFACEVAAGRWLKMLKAQKQTSLSCARRALHLGCIRPFPLCGKLSFHLLAVHVLFYRNISAGHKHTHTPAAVGTRTAVATGDRPCAQFYNEATHPRIALTINNIRQAHRLSLGTSIVICPIRFSPWLAQTRGPSRGMRSAGGHEARIAIV